MGSNDDDPKYINVLKHEEELFQLLKDDYIENYPAHGVPIDTLIKRFGMTYRQLRDFVRRFNQKYGRIRNGGVGIYSTGSRGRGKFKQVYVLSESAIKIFGLERKRRYDPVQ